MARRVVEKKKWTKECGKTKQKKREKLKRGVFVLKRGSPRVKKKRKRKGKGKCGLPLEGFRGANRAPHFLCSLEVSSSFLSLYTHIIAMILLYFMNEIFLKV